MAARQKETRLTDKIRKAVQEAHPDCWDLKVLGGNFKTAAGGRAGQRPGVPDVLLLVDGHFFGLEVKRPKKEGGGNPTVKQQHEMRKIRRAGGSAAVVRTPNEALAFIRRTLKRVAK